MCMAPDRKAADQRSALPPWSAGDSSIRMDRGRGCCEPHSSARPVDGGRCPSAPRGHVRVEPTVGRLPRIARRIVPMCMAPDRKAADQRSALPPWSAGDSSIRMDRGRRGCEPHGSARPVDRGRCPSAPRGHVGVEPTVGRLPRIARRILPMCMAPDRRAADQRSALPHGPRGIRPSEWIFGEVVANPTAPLARWIVGGVHPRPADTSRVEPTVGRLPRIARRIVPMCMAPDRRAADQRSALPPWSAGDSSVRMDLRRGCCEPHGSARPVDRGRCPSAPRGHIPGRADRWSAAVHRVADPADVHGAGSEAS